MLQRKAQLETCQANTQAGNKMLLTIEIKIIHSRPFGSVVSVNKSERTEDEYFSFQKINMIGLQNVNGSFLGVQASHPHIPAIQS